METGARPRYEAVAMAKRLQVNFRRPGPTVVAEEGQPVPCAMGVPWVNSDTLATLRKRRIPRTDAKGRPLAENPTIKR